MVRRSVGPSVCKQESKSGKTRKSAPAHPSATDGRVSGLVYMLLQEASSVCPLDQCGVTLDHGSAGLDGSFGLAWVNNSAKDSVFGTDKLITSEHTQSVIFAKKKRGTFYLEYLGF